MRQNDSREPTVAAMPVFQTFAWNLR